MGPAVWSAGTPTSSTDPTTGTLSASIPISDGGVLAATVSFTITTARVLVVNVTKEPGAAGLSDFQAWSNT